MFGKALKDIPFDKIKENLDVACVENEQKHYVFGKVVKTKKAPARVHVHSDGVDYGPVVNQIIVEFENGPTVSYDHNYCNNIVFVER